MWVYPKHPCTQLSCWQGFAVGHTRRYRCIHLNGGLQMPSLRA